MNDKRLTCIIIGENGLAVSCGKHLIEMGWEILAVVTLADEVEKWGRLNSLRVISTKHMEKLQEIKADYLFSIVNYAIIKEQLINSVNRLAINYHDALLPTYAGIHATSWAIHRGERRHGITWHVMNGGIDDGDILIQQRVAVSSNDTAFSLNLKCFQAAIESFEKLVQMLETDTIQYSKQDLSRRIYFGKWEKYENSGLIDWTQKDGQIIRDVNSMNFGEYDNTFLSPKFYYKDKLYLIDEIEKYGFDFDATPGLAKYADNSIVVATQNRPLQIKKIRSYTGENVEIEDLIEDGEKTFSIIPDIEKQKELYECTKRLCRNEAYWIDILRKISKNSKKDFALIDQLAKREISFHKDSGCSLLERVLQALADFISDCCVSDDYYIGYCETDENKELCSEIVPFCIFKKNNTDLLNNIREERERVLSKKTFLLDVFARYVGLPSDRIPYEIILVVNHRNLEIEEDNKIVIFVDENASSLECRCGAGLDDNARDFVNKLRFEFSHI